MKKKEQYSQYWETDEFEDLVARGLIAMYESKIKVAKRTIPSTRINDDLIRRIRKIGCYFAPSDRVMKIDLGQDGRSLKKQEIDIINDGRPDFCTWTRKANNLWEECYLSTIYMERINRLPKPFKTMHPGKIYRIAVLLFNERITGNCQYVTINSKGEINAVYRSVNFCEPITGRSFNIIDLPNSETDKAEDVITMWASASLQFYQDRRYLWNVQAKEGIAKATFSVHQEQIKSLFYARDLPMTDTGRKRPILHWVKSHQRRMKSGTDVDVDQYLRGTHEFIFNNTQFIITNPTKE